MENYKILLVEDDGSLIDGLEYSLKKDGFLVDIAPKCAGIPAYLREGKV